MTTPIRFDPIRLPPALQALRGEVRAFLVAEIAAGTFDPAAAGTARGYNLDIKNPHAEDVAHGDPEHLLADLTKAETETASIRDQLKAILTEALAR